MRLIVSSHATTVEAKHMGPGPHPGTRTPQLIHSAGVDATDLAPDARGTFRPKISLSDRLKARGDHFDFPMPAGKYIEGDPRNDPAYEKYVTRIQDRIDAAVASGRESHVMNAKRIIRGEDGRVAGVVLTEERIALHRAIVDSLFDERADVPRDRKAVMMGGLPGAGKSTFLMEHGSKIGLETNDRGDPVNAIVINPDDVKEKLLGTDEDPATWGKYLGPDHPQANEPLVDRVEGLRTGEHAALVHEESSILAKMIADRALTQGYNVVFDITVNDASKTESKYLRTDDRGPGALDLGYEVIGVFMDVPVATSLHRAGLRHKAPNRENGERGYTGRYVPYEHIHEALPPSGAKDRHGQDALSINRLAFDQMVANGDFAEALRIDNVTRTVYREIDPGGKVLPKPRKEGTL